jgi:hypothetical protein
MSEPTIFRDPRSATMVAAGTLAAGIALDLWAVAFVAQQMTAPAPPPPWQTLHFVVRFSTVVAVVMWSDRVYANAIAIEGRAEWSRYWATLSWFLPPYCFFRPCQLVIEASRAGERGNRRLAPWIVTWWILFLAAPLVVITSIRTQPAERAKEALTAHALNAAAAAVAICVLLGVAKAQRASQQFEVRAAIAAAKRERTLELLRLAQSAGPPSEAPRLQIARAPDEALPALPLVSPAPADIPFLAAMEAAPPPAPIPRVPAQQSSMTMRASAAIPPVAARPPMRPAPAPSLPRSSGSDLATLGTRFAELCRDRGATAGAWLGAGVGVATLVMAARTPLDAAVPMLLRGIVQAGFGSLLLLAFFLLRSAGTGPAPKSSRGWLALVGMVVLIAVLNLLALGSSLSR